MKRCIYLYGMILATRSYLLRDGFPKPDEYSEVSAEYFLPGGETGTAATVLCSLGVPVVMDGNFIGTEPAGVIRRFYADKPADLSPLTFTEDQGVTDTVIISGSERTPLGRFQTLFSSPERWWNDPRREDIDGCAAAGIDPFFREGSETAARLCVSLGVPYVTIDCLPESYMHRHASVNAVSREFTLGRFKGLPDEEILKLYQSESDGLTILTRGAQDMLYGRKGGEIKRMPAFRVDVKSTLGAGDTFKAGCIYGLMKGMNDDELVRFAAACSAAAITRFPLPLHPPVLEEVEELLR